MNLKDLIAKMDAIEKSILSEESAPAVFKPTHFHKGNLGNNLPLMMTEPGVFWWEGGNQSGEGGPVGSGIVRWQGDGENRSKWNPASVDGVIENGKYIEFPEGVTWKTYKPAVAPTPTPAKPAVKDNPALTKELLAKLSAAVQALQAAMSAPTKESREQHLSIARSLMESFGYTVDEGFNDSATDLINARQSNFNMNNGGELAINQAKRRAAAEAERAAAAAAAQKTAGAVTTAAADAAAPAATKIAQQAGITGAEQAAAKAGTKAAGMGLGKVAGKLLPGVGLAFGAKDAYDRYQKGDYLGAGLAGLAGVTSLVPGIGTAASLGLDAANLARDYKKGELGGQGAQAQVPDGGDPKVFALQQKLIAKGAKNLDGTPLVADGKMGKNTQAAMNKLGMTAESLAESIKSLQERLDLIEAKGKIRDSLESEYLWDTDGIVYTMEGVEVTDPLTLTVIWESVSTKDTTVQLDEFGGLGALAKGMWNAGKSAVKGAGDLIGGTVRGAGQVAKGGKNASDAVAKTAAKTGGAKGAGLKAGAAMARNPIKTALGATALGAAAGYGLTGSDSPDSQGGQPSTTPATTTPATTTPATTTPATTADKDLAGLIQAVKDAMTPLSDMAEGDPAIAKALSDARVLLTMAEKSGAEQGKVDAANAATAGAPQFTPKNMADVSKAVNDISLGGK